MYISSPWKVVAIIFFLNPSYALSLQLYKFSFGGCITLFTYEQNPDKASIYQQTRIDSRFHPIFFYKSQLYKFCTQETIMSNKNT